IKIRRDRADRQAEAAQIVPGVVLLVPQLDDQWLALSGRGGLPENEDGGVALSKTPPDVPDFRRFLVDGPGNVRVRPLVIETGPGAANRQGREGIFPVLRRLVEAERAQLEIARGVPSGALVGKARVGQRFQANGGDAVERRDGGNRVEVAADVVTRRQDRIIAL